VEPSCSWEVVSCAVTQEFPNIFGTRRFITVFTRTLQWSISWARLIHSIPPLYSPLRFILILSSHIHLRISSWLLPFGFPTNILYAFISPICAKFPAYFIFLDLIILIIKGQEYKLWSSSLYSFLQSPVTSSLFGPNILLSTLFSNTLSLSFYILSINGSTSLCWDFVGRFFSFLILYTVGRTPWTGDQPVARPLPAHTGQHKQNKRTQTSMLIVRFEPTIPVFERAKTVHALDRAATVIGVSTNNRVKYGR
jgi:hypothetical protein